MKAVWQIALMRGLAVAFLAGSGAGCSGVGTGMSPVRPEPADASKAPGGPGVAAFVGTVRMRQGRFVLIEAERGAIAGAAAGARLRAAGADGMAREVELRLSEERKGPFLVADILQGNPEVGDRVETVPGGNEGEARREAGAGEGAEEGTENGEGTRAGDVRNQGE